MKQSKIILAALFFILIVSSFTVLPKWRLIGQKEAKYGTDRDVLFVKGNDMYSALKIKVVDAGLNMVDMKVHFENGEVEDINIQHNFSQGEESRVIDLPGRTRRIEKITFLYDTKGILKGKANVLIFGRR